MGILQELTFLPVVGVIKTLQYIEHTAMELSESKKVVTVDTKDSTNLDEVGFFS